MMALAQDHLDRKMHSIIKGVENPKDTGLQPCWCPFCKRGTDVKVISVR